MGIRDTRSNEILSLAFLTFMFMTPARYVSPNNTMNQTQQLFVGQTMISSGQTFELGFFIPANSSKQYLGIWYKKLFFQKVVWVANIENPLLATDSASRLIIGKDGNLRLLDGMRNPVWWTNVSVQSNLPVVVLSENGDWILKDNISSFVLWESFNYPCDTFLPGMNIGINTETGEKHFLYSWNTEDDPSPGQFVAGLTPERPPQAFIWNGSVPYWRSGPWDGGKFIGIPDSDEGYASSFKLLPNNYLTLTTFNATYVIILVLTTTGSLQEIVHDREMDEIYVQWETPGTPCDVYGVCGPFAVCNMNMSSICNCLEGFVPKSIDDWRRGNWGGGCVRRTELSCQRNSNSSTTEKEKSDGFLELKGMKLPDHFECLFDVPDSLYCQQWCRSNCSCQAYAYLERICCMVWGGDLVDIQQFSYNGDSLFLRLAHSELDKEEKKENVKKENVQKKNLKQEKLIISFATISAVILLGAFIYGLYKCASIRRAKRQNTSAEASRGNVPEDDAIHEDSSELPNFEFQKILVATNNFNGANKLGEGGFGEVYKGKLENGQDVAVKRLSTRSGQGDQEFKNEIILISKLQHRNLVRLLGCCIEGGEKLLVYEYMTNRSLDKFLFDANKRMQLDWATRIKIIHGTARGLLYLHRDSRLRVIHRDMKASNILLDVDMNAKISDFGLARTFQGTQDLANTQRVVGTFGYMSPEYAIGGLFSEKSDVFSFGVLLLEIISGMKNTSFYNQGNHVHLLGYAWQLWEEKRELDLLDQALANSYTPKDVMRCIQIGLLCVQDHAAGRPTMSAVVVMLSSETELPQPKKPIFTFQSLLETDPQSDSADAYSKNQLSTTVVEGR